ncbi:hypothetical protein EXN66_Car004111 [Channa argus]|uniref:Uncharacterized protein n=1 Tax=Channa argus TaxID=215402 RepID=A0A6G1PDZ6_CHAAH|nr:hypothetical protein EXN66_Car004111 [Channa argus]KAK2917462.1 hypothetical protein Q8A73_004208 [Channa argus]
MESQDQNEPQPLISNPGCIFSTEDYLSTAIRAKVGLRDKLEESQQSDCQLMAAKGTISDLTSQLEEAHQDSDENLASLNPKPDMAEQMADTAANVSTVESANGFQAEEMDISELVWELQEAPRNLEVCTAKLLTSADSTENCDQKHSEKVQVLKKGIMDLSVKLQQEQVTLLKKAIKLVPCNTCSAQAEDLEKVICQIQKVHLELLQQALCVKNGHYKNKTSSKHHWIRAHKDQEEQTEQLEQTAEWQVGNGQENFFEKVSDDQKEKAALLFEIQQLKDKLSAEVVLRVKMETTALELEAELRRKTSVLEEAQSKVGQQEQLLLKLKEKAREELQNVESKAQVLKTHEDQEQQVDQLDKTTERRVERGQQNFCEEAGKNQKEKEALLKDKLAAEEANNKRKIQDLEAELFKKTNDVKQAEIKVYLLQKKLLTIKDEANAQRFQVEHLKKVNVGITASKKKAEEQLKVYFTQWEEEKTSLVTAVEGLNQLLNRKQHEWSEQEREMVLRLDDMEKRVAEKLERKSKNRRSWMARHFQRQGSRSTSRLQ